MQQSQMQQPQPLMTYGMNYSQLPTVGYGGVNNINRAMAMGLLGLSKPIMPEQTKMELAPISNRMPSEFQQRAYNAMEGYTKQKIADQDAQALANMYGQMGYSVPQGATAETLQSAMKMQLYANQAQEQLALRKQVADNQLQAQMMNAKSKEEQMDFLKQKDQLDRAFESEKLKIDQANKATDFGFKQAELGLKAEDIANKAQTAMQGKLLPASQVSDLQATKEGIQQLDTMMQAAQKLPNNLFDPIQGRLSVMNPYSKEAQSFNQLVAATKQTIGKGLEGGVLRKEDEVKYEKIIPKIGDTREILNMKAAQLRSMMANKYDSQRAGFAQAGYNVGNFAPVRGRPRLTREQAMQLARQRGLIK